MRIAVLAFALLATPALAARILPEKSAQPGRVSRALERGFRSIERRYAHALDWALGHRRLVLLMLARGGRGQQRPERRDAQPLGLDQARAVVWLTATKRCGVSRTSSAACSIGSRGGVCSVVTTGIPASAAAGRPWASSGPPLISSRAPESRSR